MRSRRISHSLCVMLHPKSTRPQSGVYARAQKTFFNLGSDLFEPPPPPPLPEPLLPPPPLPPRDPLVEADELCFLDTPTPTPMATAATMTRATPSMLNNYMRVRYGPGEECGTHNDLAAVRMGGFERFHGSRERNRDRTGNVEDLKWRI